MSLEPTSIRSALSLAMLVGALLIDVSAGAQFAPSGGAGLQAEESTEPGADTDAPADAEKPQQPIAGFDKGNFNGFFIQSPDGEFRFNIGAYTQFRYNLVWLYVGKTFRTRGHVY